MMKVIAISNQKGGCGKTTTAINLGSCLASLQQRVLIIDLDPQGHATYGLGVDSSKLERSIYHALTSLADKKAPLENVILNIWGNLDLAPSHILLSTIEQELRDVEGAVSKLYNLFNGISKPYDYVIIDCPPSLGFLTFNALRAAHMVIIPVETSRFSLFGISKLMNMVELISLKLQHTPKIKALVTIFDKRTNFSQKMYEEIRKFFKDNLLKTTIRINVTLKEAVNAGLPVNRYNKYSNGTQDYMSLADEIQKEANKVHLENFYREAEALIRKASSFRKTFSIEQKNAKEVYIVGDFNNWSINDAARLSSNDNGRWERAFELKPGTYRYKFVVDGQWLQDPNNTATETNPFGGIDSVVTVTA